MAYGYGAPAAYKMKDFLDYCYGCMTGKRQSFIRGFNFFKSFHWPPHLHSVCHTRQRNCLWKKVYFQTRVKIGSNYCIKVLVFVLCPTESAAHCLAKYYCPCQFVQSRFGHDSHCDEMPKCVLPEQIWAPFSDKHSTLDDELPLV